MSSYQNAKAAAELFSASADEDEADAPVQVHARPRTPWSITRSVLLAPAGWAKAGWDLPANSVRGPFLFSAGCCTYAAAAIVLLALLFPSDSPSPDSRFSAEAALYPSVVADLGQKDHWTASDNTQAFLTDAGYRSMQLNVDLGRAEMSGKTLSLPSFEGGVRILFGRDGGELTSASTAPLVAYICPASGSCFRHK